MFIGRRDELANLEEICGNDRNNLLILYGRLGIGKTTLVNRFLENRQGVYYCASEATVFEQKQRLIRTAGEKLGAFASMVEEGEEPAYSALLPALFSGSGDGKRILVIDEFDYIADARGEFAQALSALLDDGENKYMVVLISSSVIFVEQRMVDALGMLARKITGFMKLKPLTFAETVEMFPRLSVEECIMINAVFGGIPRYLSKWQENRRFRENVLSMVMNPDALFHNEAEYLLKTELRELGAYNAILYAMASGKNKLNDIYRATGFSRAKISVYLKNLICMDLVEKAFSFDTRDKTEIQKGLYRIKDNFLCFWYRYIFPNRTELEQQKIKTVYDEYFIADTPEFMRSHFANVCSEFLRLMNRYGKLKHNYGEPGIWYGKKGRLDIVMQDDRRNALAAVCIWQDAEVDEDTLNEMEELSDAAKLKLSEVYIFAKKGFSSKLTRISTSSDSLHLVPLSSL